LDSLIQRSVAPAPPPNVAASLSDGIDRAGTTNRRSRHRNGGTNASAIRSPNNINNNNSSSSSSSSSSGGGRSGSSNAPGNTARPPAPSPVPANAQFVRSRAKKHAWISYRALAACAVRIRVKHLIPQLGVQLGYTDILTAVEGQRRFLHSALAHTDKEINNHKEMYPEPPPRPLTHARAGRVETATSPPSTASAAAASASASLPPPSSSSEAVPSDDGGPPISAGEQKEYLEILRGLLKIAMIKVARTREGYLRAFHGTTACAILESSDVALIPDVVVNDWRKASPVTIRVMALGRMLITLARKAKAIGRSMLCCREDYTTRMCLNCSLCEPRGSLLLVTCSGCGAASHRDMGFAASAVLSRRLIHGAEAVRALQYLASGAGGLAAGSPDLEE